MEYLASRVFIGPDVKVMTLGEQRVRVTFNPSLDGKVDQIKQKTAELINLCSDAKTTGHHLIDGETGRLWSLAMTSYEEAAMWAVKAATTAGAT